MPDKNEQDYFREKLAVWLGITFEELEEYGEDVEPVENDNEVEDFDYQIQFSELTPLEILQKIGRIDADGVVYFNLEELDEVGD